MGMLSRKVFLSTAAAAVIAIGCGDSAQTTIYDAAPDNAGNAADSGLDGSGDAPVVDPSTLPRILTLSNRADLISSGDALVEIVLPGGAQPEQLHVTLGSANITSVFAMRSNGRVLGLVTGLVEGQNQLSADLGTGHGTTLTITNHSIGGPVFSGPQSLPFVCATPTAQSENGNQPRTNASGLSTMATDGQCDIASESRLFYRTTSACNPLVNSDPVPFPTNPAAGACFKPYVPANPPADLAMTTTDTGATVPFIVRVERGTVNRGIYDIAVLFDPSQDDFQNGWKPYAPQAGWNGKVLYGFGPGVGQPRLQSHASLSWADATITTNGAALARGYMVAVNSMTDSLFNANQVVVSETVMMMKEKIIDTYGEVRFVMGVGCAGGSLDELATASIYPGLLDGIQTSCTLPDAETTAMEPTDCALLVHFYNSPAWATLTVGLTQDQINAKKAAINGHLDQSGCHAWVNSLSNLNRPGSYTPTIVLNNTTGETGPDPRVTTPINNCQLPASMVYDPITNPSGVRCSAADQEGAIFGTTTDPGSGITHVRTRYDNVGVQYGLEAFLFGAITAEEFVSLNESIGGIDFDGGFMAARSQSDPEAVAIAYRAGLVASGRHLAQTPILDLRGWDERAIFHVWRSFGLRDRLDAANGTHFNHVMWRFPQVLTPVQSPDPATANLVMQSFMMMDQWLGDIKADSSDLSIGDKILTHRPAAAFDFCNKPIDVTHSVQVTDGAVCDADPTLQPHRSPRQVAGGPRSEDVLKCQLRALKRADYNPVGMTDAQFNRIKAVFSDGVCDFGRPGVGQAAVESPLDFSAGSGGAPFLDPPQTQAF